MRVTSVLASFALVACNPPAAEEFEQQSVPAQGAGPSDPLPSPDTGGALWVPSGDQRLVYGVPGNPPLMALSCIEGERGEARIGYTRFATADAGAKAVLALIGNGHVARIFVDAEEDGERWVWRGSVAADSPELETLTGPRRVEATIPGAGSMILNPSALPGELISACRQNLPPAPAAEQA